MSETEVPPVLMPPNLADQAGTGRSQLAQMLAGLPAGETSTSAQSSTRALTVGIAAMMRYRRAVHAPTPRVSATAKLA